MESNAGLSRAIISRRSRLQGRKKRSNGAPAPIYMEAVEEYNIGLANAIIHEKGRLQ
jgi:hypothetical protein